MELVKCPKIKIEKSDTKKNIRKIEREKYGNGDIKIEVLNDFERQEESESEYIDQLKREIRCLKRANVSAKCETEIWKKKYREMETEFMKLKGVAMCENELEAYRLENSGLLALVEEKSRECVGLEEKLNDLSSRKDAVDVELKERVTQLEEAHRFMCEKEEQEEILYLSNVKYNCEQLERTNRELEFEINRLNKEHIDNVLMCKDLKDQNAYLKEHQSIVCEREKVALNGITDLSKEIRSFTSEKRLRIRAYSLDLNCVPKNVFDNDEENNYGNKGEEVQGETRDRSGKIMSESRNRSEEIRSDKSEGIQLKATVCEALPTVEGDWNIPIDIESDSIVEISDTEDSSGSDDDLQSHSRFDTPLSGQRCDGHLISCKKELPLSSTPKRKWVAETGMSEIRTDNEDNMKKLNAGQNMQHSD